MPVDSGAIDRDVAKLNRPPPIGTHRCEAKDAIGDGVLVEDLLRSNPGSRQALEGFKADVQPSSQTGLGKCALSQDTRGLAV
eukprot:1339252-Amorphochlora_amoeboformis.AAC.1